MRLFLDANILYSAACKDGAIRRLIAELRSSGHVLVVDGYVGEEALRNVALRRPSAVEFLHHLSIELELHAGTVSSTVTQSPDWELPVVDEAVMAAAIALRCQVLITGDVSHFGQHYGTKVAGVGILSPRQAALALLGAGHSQTSFRLLRP